MSNYTKSRGFTKSRGVALDGEERDLVTRFWPQLLQALELRPVPSTRVLEEYLCEYVEQTRGYHDIPRSLENMVAPFRQTHNRVEDTERAAAADDDYDENDDENDDDDDTPLFTANQMYTFTSDHGTKMRCKDDGGVDLNRRAPAYSQAWKHVWLAGNLYAWESNHVRGNYLTGWNDRTVQSKPWRHGWEVWEHIRDDGGRRSVWKSVAHGNYLSGDSDGSVKLAPHIDCWESWEMRPMY